MADAKVDTFDTRKSYHKIKRQIFAALIGNLIIIGQGCSVGWFSPSLLILLSENAPLSGGSISLVEASWIGSIMAIGAIAGTISFGIISNYVGSKAGVLWSSIPIMIHWIMIKFSNYAWQIVIARFLTGFSGGAAFICIPLFIAEIAENHVRGSLTSLLPINHNVGMLFGLILGSIVDYGTFPLVVLTFPTLFFVLFLFFPNSPQHLLKYNRIEDAEKSLKFYRNYDPNSRDDHLNFVIEFEKLKAIAQQNKVADGWKLSDLYEPVALKGIIIGIILMMISGFSGGFTLMNYAATVFKESGSDIDPNISAIALGSLQICGTICTIAIIDRMGRKFLMLISCAGVAVSVSVMGVYSYLSKHGYDVTSCNLVPIISLSSAIYLNALGINPVPYVLVAEILPQKVRRAGATICVTSVSIFAFISLKVFPLLMTVIEIYGCMAIFSSFAIFGLVFTIFVIKETKGKNLDVLECKK